MKGDEKIMNLDFIARLVLIYLYITTPTSSMTSSLWRAGIRKKITMVVTVNQGEHNPNGQLKFYCLPDHLSKLDGMNLKIKRFHHQFVPLGVKCFI